VPSDKFWQEFPDGVIPIKHTEHLVWRDPDNKEDVLQALKDTIAVFDQTRNILRTRTASDIISLMETYRELPVKQYAERRQILSTLCSEGLSLRTIVRLTEEPNALTRVMQAMMNSHSTSSPEYCEKVLVADEMKMAGAAPEEIKAATGLTTNTLRIIDRWRACSDVGYEGCLKWAFTQIMNGMNTAEVIRLMHVKFPQDAQHIPYHTVYSLARPNRLERNKKRFGWIDDEEQA
jgi:hypothetical protein